MKAIVSTIITKDYGHYALALHDSLTQFDKSVHFCVFISNGVLPKNIERELRSRPHIILFFSDDFTEDIALQLKSKYADIYHDAYRWGMKPILLNKLLQIGYDQAIYVDSDIYFFNDYKFLFQELESKKILLSPHWRSSCPIEDLPNFKLNFLDGIYNGGFVGASNGAEPILLYWAELCLFACKVDRGNGFYVDQRYLDILPTRFEGVGHIIHKGCNVANWNQIDCKRVLQEDGTVLINSVMPIVFIHFTNSFFKGVYLEPKKDSVLKPYLEAYRDNLLKYSEVDVIALFFEKGAKQSPRNESDFDKKPKKDSLSKQIKKAIKKLIR